MKQVKIGKAHIDNLSIEESVKLVLQYIETNEKGYVVTPNVDHIVKLENDEEFLDVYKNAIIRIPDGMPLIWASKLFGSPLKEKVSGSDVFPLICKAAGEKGYGVFFLGGRDGVAEQAAANLKRVIKNLKVSGIYSPPFGFESDHKENEKIVRMINESSTNILFVGLGAPKQEKWIYNNISKLNINVALGIGASFDFVAGTLKRAPKFMQQYGFEWLWRLIHEPKRLFKRYIIEDSAFILIILKQMLFKAK